MQRAGGGTAANGYDKRPHAKGDPMTVRALQTEAGTGPATQLLLRYDPAARTWDFAKNGEFWEAVTLAHSLGQYGSGRRVAIIDDGFDITLPVLASHTLRSIGPPNAPSAHGTAVALLLLEVAPEAELLLYPTANTNDAHLEIDEDAVAAAINDAVKQNVHVINLSLGKAVPVTELFSAQNFFADAPKTDDTTAEDLVFWAAQRAATLDVRETLMLGADALTSAVEAAVAAGVVIVAAAGNDADHFFVPAAMAGTIAAGFTRIRTEVIGGFESVSLRVPSFTQSVLTDFTVVQPPDVLGSSFASPLIAGLAVVARDPQTLVELKPAVRRSGWATRLWRDYPQDEWRPDRQGVIDELFKAAVNKAPHHHHWQQGRYQCPECAFLLYPAYNNYGLFTLGWKDFTHAEVVLNTARSIAPYRFEAPANLAVALRELAVGVRGDDAVRLLAAACEASAASLARRPSYGPYLDTFHDLVNQLDNTINYQGEEAMTDIQIRVRIDDEDDLAAATQLAEAEGIELQQAPASPDGGVDALIAPIAAVLIGAGVLAVAKFITDWLRRTDQENKGGLVIDQRADAKDDIYRDKDVPYGFLVIYPKDGGEVKVDVKKAPEESVDRWISEVISGAYKTISDLAKLVSDKPADEQLKLVDTSA